jgi:hypothetical protein
LLHLSRCPLLGRLRGLIRIPALMSPSTKPAGAGARNVCQDVNTVFRRATKPTTARFVTEWRGRVASISRGARRCADGSPRESRLHDARALLPSGADQDAAWIAVAHRVWAESSGKSRRPGALMIGIVRRSAPRSGVLVGASAHREPVHGLVRSPGVVVKVIAGLDPRLPRRVPQKLGGHACCA